MLESQLEHATTYRKGWWNINLSWQRLDKVKLTKLAPNKQLFIIQNFVKEVQRNQGARGILSSLKFRRQWLINLRMPQASAYRDVDSPDDPPPPFWLSWPSVIMSQNFDT